MALTLRSYRPADRSACLELFRSNVPHFFAPHEEAEFTDFLDHEIETCDYVVVEEAGTLLGCGGTFVKDGTNGRVAGLCWGMVDNTRHRRGIGSFLLLGRLGRLYRNQLEVEEIKLDTTQHSQGFFARFGFVTIRVTEDGYAPGLDRYDMTLTRAALTDLLRPNLLHSDSLRPDLLR